MFPIAMFDYRRVTVTRHRSSTNPHNHCENLDVQKSLRKRWPVKLSSPSMDHLIIFRMREWKRRFYWKLPFLFLRCFLFCTVIFVWKSDLPKIPWSIIILLMIMTILGVFPHEIPMISPCLLVLPFHMAFQPESLPYHFCQALHSRPALSGQIRQGETHRKAFPAAKASRYRKKWRFQCAKSIERHVTILNPQWIVFAEQITGYIWNILHVSLVWTSYIFILKYCLGFKTSGNHYWLPEATWQ
jgi:hypothetical protein